MPRPKKNQTPQTPRGKAEAALIKHSMAGQDIVDSINGMSEDECKAKLATLSTYENETESAQKEDEDIVRLKEDLKETQAPYKEKGIKLERHLLGFRLEELGKA
jgi:FtsZ-binding cell division protein ZapB